MHKSWCFETKKQKRQNLLHSPSETMLYRKKLQHVWAAVLPFWLNAAEVKAEKHAALFTCSTLTVCWYQTEMQTESPNTCFSCTDKQACHSLLNKSVKTQTQSLPHRRAHFLSLKETNIILFLHAHAQKNHSQCQTIPTFLSDKAALHPQKKACLSESDAQWDIHILVSPVKYSTHLDTHIQTK